MCSQAEPPTSWSAMGNPMAVTSWQALPVAGLLFFLHRPAAALVGLRVGLPAGKLIRLYFALPIRLLPMLEHAVPGQVLLMWVTKLYDCWPSTHLVEPFTIDYLMFDETRHKVRVPGLRSLMQGIHIKDSPHLRKSARPLLGGAGGGGGGRENGYLSGNVESWVTTAAIS